MSQQSSGPPLQHTSHSSKLSRWKGRQREQGGHQRAPPSTDTEGRWHPLSRPVPERTPSAPLTAAECECRTSLAFQSWKSSWQELSHPLADHTLSEGPFYTAWSGDRGGSLLRERLRSATCTGTCLPTGPRGCVRTGSKLCSRQRPRFIIEAGKRDASYLQDQSTLGPGPELFPPARCHPRQARG